MGLTDLYRHGAGTFTLFEIKRTAAEGMWCRVSQLGNEAWIDPLSDLPFLDGACLSFRKTFGLCPLAFDNVDPSRLYVYYADDVQSLTVYDVLTGEEIGRIQIDGHTDGLVAVVDGRPVWRQDRAIPGFAVKWACCIETPNWIVGGYGNALFPGALARYHKPTGQVSYWAGYTPVPHSALEFAGELRVYINGVANSPEPNELEWVAALPEPAPAPLPVILFPTPRAIWRGDLSGVVPGNCGGTGHPSAVVEDVLWLTPADDDKLIGLYLGPEPPRFGTKDEQIAKTIDKALERKVPVYVYDDGQNVEATALRCEKAGCTVVDLVQAYPRHEEPRFQFVQRVIRKFSPHGTITRKVGLVRAGYTVSGTTEFEMAESNLEALQLLEDFREVMVIDLTFGLDRPPRSLWARQLQLALTAATPTPARPTEPPVVVPPVVVPRDPPKDRRPGGKAAQVLPWVGAISAGVAALIDLFRRQKR